MPDELEHLEALANLGDENAQRALHELRIQRGLPADLIYSGELLQSLRSAYLRQTRSIHNHLSKSLGSSLQLTLTKLLDNYPLITDLYAPLYNKREIVTDVFTARHPIRPNKHRDLKFRSLIVYFEKKNIRIPNCPDHPTEKGHLCVDLYDQSVEEDLEGYGLLPLYQDLIKFLNMLNICEILPQLMQAIKHNKIKRYHGRAEIIEGREEVQGGIQFFPDYLSISSISRDIHFQILTPS